VTRDSAGAPCRGAPLGLDPDSARSARRVLEGARKHALERGRARLMLTGIGFACAFAVIAVRLVGVSTGGDSLAGGIAGSEPTAPAVRAEIVDRNGVLLAKTLPTISLFANPHQIADVRETVRRLAPELPEQSPATLAARLAADQGFVWLQRSLSPRRAQRINSLGIPGLYFRDEAARVYPQGALTAHLVGYADVDNKGIAGLEQAFDRSLGAGSGPLRLSLDLRVQHILTEELALAIASFDAIGGAGLVLDAHSGEVLAMASLPSFQPDEVGTANPEARFNRASLGIYEMGSVFKIFTTAMVLDQGLVRLADRFDVSEPIRAARFVIRDFKPKHRPLSVAEIFIYSSNIGTVHMVMEAGTRRQQRFLRQLGLTRRTTLELPEAGLPLTPSPWREINTMTVSYGHGMAVSPIQLASAVAAIVNGGEVVPATLVRRDGAAPYLVERVVSEQTSEQMRWMMRMAVLHGTGRQAEAAGYLVGGKTGTSDKVAGRRYASDARISSFAGAFPMDQPRYVVFAMIDEPKGKKSTFGYATGGWVAAPVIRGIVERAAPLLGVEPRTAEEVALLDEAMTPSSAKGFVLAAN